MELSKITEELNKYINEDELLRKGKSLKGTEYDEYDKGIVTIEVLGCPLSYQVSEIVSPDEEDQKLFGGIRIQKSKDFDEQIKVLETTIKRQVLNALKAETNLDLSYVGGSSLIGIPNSIK